MKTFFKLTILISLISCMVACEEKSTTSTLSAVAQITAFSFEANDSIPGLGNAVFVVEQMTDTGLIRMRENDSIQYGTSLQAVIPDITYYTTPSSVVFYLGDSAITLTGYDTLNLEFNNDSIPIRIHVVAQNTDYDKWYRLRFAKHTMDGDYFHWDTLHTAISDQTYGTQKALMFNQKFYYYQNDGYTTRVFISSDMGETWSESPVTGLPASCKIRQIVEGDSLLFYGDKQQIYYSRNGYVWEHIDTPVEIIALYMCMHTNENRIWLAAKDAQGCARFYSIGSDLNLCLQSKIGLPGDSLPLSFPIEEYATVPFQSSSLHQHALIAGGYDREGNMTSARWNLEYNYIYDTYKITNMADENKDFPSFAGSSISYYGTFLYLLGGIYGNDRSYLQNVYTSTDEGMHWVEVSDSTNHKRPENISGRHHTNTFVDEESGNIYIIGGEDNSTTYSDVYRGRMNSIKWPEIGN